MRIVNLTQHTLNIHHPGGVLVLLPSGEVVRASEARTATGTVNVGALKIPTDVCQLGAPIGVPEAPDFSRIWVVSALAAASMRDHNAVPSNVRLFRPGALVRNEAGRPVGCLGLTEVAS